MTDKAPAVQSADTSTTAIQRFAHGFLQEPGYLDYGRVGPLSATVVAELHGGTELLSRARFGSLDAFSAESARLHTAVSAVIGFPADQIVTQPNTGTALMHAMFGLTGGALLSPSEFPSVTLAVARAAESLHAVTPVWLRTDHGRVTPGQIREQVTAHTTAAAVSLVDSRTGYLADIEGIRQVIGDRLLIVDAIQGLGVVDAPYELADVVASGGHKWTRAGWGTGFMAMSERAIEQITPVISGSTGTDAAEPFDEIFPPTHGVRAFSVAHPDRLAEARFAAALEELDTVGVADVQAAVSANVDAIIDLADAFAIPVASSRDPSERAGIVVLQPPEHRLTLLSASLFNHGVTVTSRGASVRLSVHAVMDDETAGMVRAAFASYVAVS
jgi:selenocysteine lyase/cysteine desulfurase